MTDQPVKRFYADALNGSLKTFNGLSGQINHFGPEFRIGSAEKCLQIGNDALSFGNINGNGMFTVKLFRDLALSEPGSKVPRAEVLYSDMQFRLQGFVPVAHQQVVFLTGGTDQMKRVKREVKVFDLDNNTLSNYPRNMHDKRRDHGACMIG